MGPKEGQLGLDWLLLAIGSEDGLSGIHAEFIQGIFEHLPPHFPLLCRGVILEAWDGEPPPLHFGALLDLGLSQDTQ
jgi:hypothetical protein